MSAAIPKNNIHSSSVRMALYVCGRTLPIAQLGPNFLVLANPIDHPPTDAEISMSIDGHEERWPIRLGAGIKVSERKTVISKPLTVNGSMASSPVPTPAGSTGR
jgi:hypothetical protein